LTWDVSGANLLSGACTSAPVAGEAFKALWALISGLQLATGKVEQRQGFPLAVLRGYAETWCRVDEGSSKVAELVTDYVAKSRGVQIAGCYSLLHGSDTALSATMQVLTLLC
jgi:hypothetical protein